MKKISFQNCLSEFVTLFKEILYFLQYMLQALLLTIQPLKNIKANSNLSKIIYIIIAYKIYMYI